MDIIRLYGKTVRTWNETKEDGRIKTTQMEVEYRDYYPDGTLKQTGTEDFSPQRYSAAVHEKYIWAWDGQTLNRGGYRKFEEVGKIKYNRSQSRLIRPFLKIMYNEAERIELR